MGSKPANAGLRYTHLRPLTGPVRFAARPVYRFRATQESSGFWPGSLDSLKSLRTKILCGFGKPRFDSFEPGLFVFPGANCSAARCNSGGCKLDCYSMPPQPTTAKETLRLLRFLHLTFLFSLVLLNVTMRMLHNEAPTNPPSSAVVIMMFALAVVDLTIGATIRSRRLGTAFETLRRQPNDSAALQQWIQGSILGDCMAMSTALFGFVLHVLGEPYSISDPFFIAALAALVVWWPKQTD